MKEAVRTRLFWVVAALAIVALVAVGLISAAAQADSVAYDSCCTNAEEVNQEFGNKDV